MKGFVRRKSAMLLYILLSHTKRLWSDELYIKYLYYFYFGKPLDLKNPRTYNEKCQWLKLFNRKPIYTTMVDKYLVKEYVKQRIGEGYVIPCYGVWQNANEIDYDLLPEVFVLKCNHDSSSVIVVKDKNSIDKQAVTKKLNKCLRTTYYYGSREWPYKNVKPCIFAEMLLDEGTGKELHDYKFWCFNGHPTYMYITNKGKVVKENFYDMDFNPVDINHGFYRTVPEYSKPDCFEEMKNLAEKLSQGIPFVRVDFFYVNGKVYFSEFTFFDWGGTRPFIPEETDYSLGGMLQLPQVYNH